MTQLSAYIGPVHDLEKEEGKKHAVSSAVGGLVFHFCRIDNDGKSSKRHSKGLKLLKLANAPLAGSPNMITGLV